MNRYLHAGICAAIGFIKFCTIKLERGASFSCSGINLVSPRTEIALDRGGRLSLGPGFRMRSGAKLRVRKGADVEIGKNFSMSNTCMIVSRQQIHIGDDVQFGPGVYVYDHDHDVSVPGGLKAEKYKTAPIRIGNSVWIGANSVILRGTTIGDNSVVGAGSVIKGDFPANSLITQKRDTQIRAINYAENGGE